MKFLVVIFNSILRQNRKLYKIFSNFYLIHVSWAIILKKIIFKL